MRAYYRVDGDKLREARVYAMLSQAALAEKSGISIETIWGIERPSRNLRYTEGQRSSTVICLANALEVTPRSLLWISSPHGEEGGEEPPHSPGNDGGTTGGKNAVSSRFGFDLDLGGGVDLEPDTPNAEGKDLRTQASVNGNGHSPFAIDDHQQAILLRLWERGPGWAGELTYGGLVKLMKDHGAGAVNDALEDLIEHADEVQRPYPYLAKVAAELAQSHTQGVRG